MTDQSSWMSPAPRPHLLFRHHPVARRLPAVADPRTLVWKDPAVRRRTTGLVLAIAVVVLGLSTLAGSRMVMLAGLGVVGAALLLLDLPRMKRLLLAVIVLEMAVPVDQYLGYSDAVAETSTLSGFVVGLGTFATLILTLLIAAEWLGGLRRAASPVPVIPRASIVYMVLLALSVAWAIEPILAANEAFLVGQAMLGYVCVVATLRNRRDVIFGISLMAAGLAIQSALVLAAVPFGGSLTIGLINVTEFFDRAAGSFGSANVLASFVTLSLAPALALIVMQVEPWRRLLGWTALGLASATLVLTESRGGWIGAAVALGVFAVGARRRHWLSRRIMVGASILGAAGAVLFGARLLERLGQFGNEAAQARLPLNRLALSIIGDNPIFGAGANNFAAAMRTHLTIDYSNDWISTVHNKYLLVWAETGLVGLISFFAVVGGIVWCGWLLWKMRETVFSPFGLAVVGSVLGTMAHMLVELFHARVQYQALWLIAGLAQCALLVARRESTRTPDLDTAGVP